LYIGTANSGPQFAGGSHLRGHAVLIIFLIAARVADAGLTCSRPPAETPAIRIP
jgi:hypothetical protein